MSVSITDFKKNEKIAAKARKTQENPLRFLRILNRLCENRSLKILDILGNVGTAED